MKHYSDIKNIDDLSNHGSVQKMMKKKNKVILRVFEKNPRLLLHDEQVVLRKKSLNIWHYKMFTGSWSEISKHSEETAVQKTSKKDSFGRKKIWTGTKDLDWDKVIFFGWKFFLRHVFFHHTWSVHTNRLIQRTVKHPVKIHVWDCFSKQKFGTLYIFTDNLIAKMVKLYQRALLPSAQRWFMRKNDGYCKRTTWPKISESSLYCVETRKWHWRIGLAVAVTRCKSHRKCLGTHKVQTPRKEDLNRQAVISIDSIFCLKIML